MRDGRVGQHALDPAFAEGQEIADEHREAGDQREGPGVDADRSYAEGGEEAHEEYDHGSLRTVATKAVTGAGAAS